MEKKGEITVFLSLVVICVLSLLLNLVESARTVGAGLYLRMAADSSVDSLMSQYNRGLWEQYQLLFLEYESPAAIEKSYESYFNFYMNQKNFYPMKLEQSHATRIVNMQDEGAKALETEILSYIKYRLPDFFDDTENVKGILDTTSKAGGFKELLNVCKKAGKETIRLEKILGNIQSSLKKQSAMEELLDKAVEDEKKSRLRSEASKLRKEMGRFPGMAQEYQKELNQIKAHRAQIEAEQLKTGEEESERYLQQELSAYTQVEEAAEKTYQELQSAGEAIERSIEYLDALLSLTGEDGWEKEDGWSDAGELAAGVEIPVLEIEGEADQEKIAALERLEQVLSQDILTLLVPSGTEISSNRISLSNIPSANNKAEAGRQPLGLDLLLINEYIKLYFGNFITGAAPSEKKNSLVYEQEYLLAGKASDRENLKTVAEELLAVRGAVNLLYLLSSPEKKAEADTLAAAISAAFPAAQAVLSFFILALWAFGEAVADLRCLFAGGKVPVWKSESSWQTDLTGLLKLEFGDWGGGSVDTDQASGLSYEAYLSFLFCLQNRQIRNFRMMDVIQWNIRKSQADFDVEKCAFLVQINSDVEEKHCFSSKTSYKTQISAEKSY